MSTENTKPTAFTYSDAAGRAWTVSITVGTVTRVREMLGVDLMQALEGDLVPKLMHDPVMLCNVLYCACKPEADARGLTDVQFGESMGGDSLAAGEEALLEAIRFFSHPSRRDLFWAMVAKTRELRTRAAAMGRKRLDDPRLDRYLTEQLNAMATIEGLVVPESPPTKPGDSSGNLPESSMSTPAA
jgi:hypothetical protein